MSVLMEWIENGARVLEPALGQDARREAQILFSKASGRPLHDFFSKGVIDSGDRIKEKFDALVDKRKTRFPLQYLLEEVPFFDVTLRIDQRCLIPRPETELLVEEAVKILGSREGGKNVLDIGTGSGNIAIGLANACRDVSVLAVDISFGALSVARENSALNEVADRIEWVNSDCFEALGGVFFDLIVSNPPYLETADFDGLQPELQYEPKAALDGGKDGLTILRKIVYNAVDFLKAGGVLLVEVGDRQAEAVSRLFRENQFSGVQVYPDYRGIGRIISGVFCG